MGYGRKDPQTIRIEATTDAGLKQKVDGLESQLAESEQKQQDMRNVINWELNSKARRKRGMTVFISDDGWKQDYTVMYPLLKSVGVVGCVGVVSTNVGRTSNYATQSELLEMQNDGWEMMSHSKTHPGSPPMADNTSNSFVESEFRDSKLQLEAMGFEINNYVYPGGNYREREKNFAKQYYRAARCSDGYWDGIPLNYPPLTTHELKTVWLDSLSSPLSAYLGSSQYTRAEAIQKTLDEMKEIIDEAKAKDALLIISTHFYNMVDQDYQDLFRAVAEYARDNTLVTTLNDALNQMGNIVDVGDYSQLGKRVASGKPHFVMGANGVVSGSVTVTQRDAFTITNKYKDFPHGVSYIPISGSMATATGTPENRAGILVNYRLDDLDIKQNYQEYIIYNSDKVYRRQAIDDSSYGQFKLRPRVTSADDNAFTFSTPLRDYPVGTTYSIITTNNPEIGSSPNGERGTLITHKVSATVAGYSYQEFRANGYADYKRLASDLDTWRPWATL